MPPAKGVSTKIKRLDPNRKLTWTHDVSLHVHNITFFVLVENDTCKKLEQRYKLTIRAVLSQLSLLLSKNINNFWVEAIHRSKHCQNVNHSTYIFWFYLF